MYICTSTHVFFYRTTPLNIIMDGWDFVSTSSTIMPDILLLKDVLHFSLEDDPLQAVEPYPFPRSQGSPLPFRTSFTCEEFRSFWNRERIAFQWVYCSEKNSRSFYLHSKSPDSPLPSFVRAPGMNAKGPGPGRLYDWTLKHECRQWDQGQQLTLKRDSVGQGCPVYIRMRKLVDEDRVEVEYHWEHNHSTEPKARSVFPLGPNELHWVRRMIQEGHQWKAIKKKLRPDEEHLQRVMSMVRTDMLLKLGCSLLML